MSVLNDKESNMTDVEISSKENEISPNEIFKKMVINDKEQNKRLSANLSNGINESGFKKVGSSINQRNNNDSDRTIMRFFVCVLGLLALTTSQMSRIVLNQSLPIMVHKSMMKSENKTTDGSCPSSSSSSSENQTSIYITTIPTTLIFSTTVQPLVETTINSNGYTIEGYTTISNLFNDDKQTTLAMEVENQEVFTTTIPETTTKTTLQELYTTTKSETTTTTQIIDNQQVFTTDIIPERTTIVSEFINTVEPTDLVDSTTKSDGSNKDYTTTISYTSNDNEYITTTNNNNNQQFVDEYTKEEGKSEVEELVLDNNNHDNEEEKTDTFYWDNDYQSTLLGGFYYGYFLFMIPGGRIAEAYGAKYVLFVSVAGSAIINLATPWMARNSFTLLVCSRVLMGAIQSGVFPGMYALFNEWLTMSEASIFAPLIKMNLRLGMMFGSGLCGLSKYNWPNTFYSTGLICSIWSILWLFISTSNPKDNRWVSKKELDHINKKKRKQPNNINEKIHDGKQEMELADRNNSNQLELNKDDDDKKVNVSEKTPWLKLLTNSSVIGLIIVKLTFNYAIDFMVILLPKYLHNVFHAGPEIVSYITLPMFGIQVVLVVFVGWFAKFIVKKRPYNLSKTTIRKIFQVSSNGGMAIFLILLTFNDCNLTYVAIILQIISFLSMFTAGGETMLPYDLSQKYPATIMAIANCVANLSGLTTTEISRQVLRGQASSFDRWNLLIYLMAGANIIGSLAFVILVKAEPIDFTKKNKKNFSEIHKNGNQEMLTDNNNNNNNKRDKLSITIENKKFDNNNKLNLNQQQEGEKEQMDNDRLTSVVVNEIKVDNKQNIQKVKNVENIKL